MIALINYRVIENYLKYLYQKREIVLENRLVPFRNFLAKHGTV